MKTPELINGRTQDEVKRDIERCGNDNGCNGCRNIGNTDCVETNMKNALTLIQRLEADREALLKIAHDYAGCSECIHVDNKPELPPCSSCGVLGKNWVWRGAGKEQTNENA